MPNVSSITTLEQTIRRSTRAQQSRRQGTAIDPDAVPNLGGRWDGALHAGALSPLDYGWGGWSDTGTPPWEPNHELSLIGYGGIYMRDRHRETIAGIVYQSHVAGDRTVETDGNCSLTVQENFTSSVAGTDALEVHGNVDWHTHDRITLGKGNVNRRWEGGILRMIGMEGVIAGGAFLKTFTGISMTMAPLASGDVYGGCAGAAGTRVRIASHMGYRSSEMCAWACGLYLRACATVIEPIVGTPSADAPRKMWQKAGRIGLGICPIADILFGVCMVPVGIAMAIRAKVKGIKRPDTPQGKPRIHTRNGAVVAQGRASDTIM